MSRLASYPVFHQALLPASKSWAQKVRNFWCWFGEHNWEVLASKATSWVSDIEWRRCKCCHREEVEERVYY
jgi:hypothetical protein